MISCVAYVSYKATIYYLFPTIIQSKAIDYILTMDRIGISSNNTILQFDFLIMSLSGINYI